MNDSTNINEPRRIALLLADRAVQPLTDLEQQELDALLGAHPEIDEFELDEVAAMFQLAQPVLAESMPDTLRARLFADAENFYATQPTTVQVVERSALEQATVTTNAAVPGDLAGATLVRPNVAANTLAETQPVRANVSTRADALPNSSAETTNVLTFPRAERRSSWADMFQWGGWLAAAACLALAATGWWQARQYREQIAAELNKVPPSFSEQRAALLQQGASVTQLDWAPSTYPGMQKVRGDVVWNNAEQKGFLRFTGMPVNDREKLVYQLWIFDANQDERYPIDGGVFDITSNGEVLVPIKAKINVVTPMLFAVTIEKPGGVVVSSREKLALLAKKG